MWENYSDNQDACNYCSKFYKNSLSEISLILNNYHQVNHDEKYWDTILRPWLFIYIQVMFDRYQNINSVKKKFKKIFSYTLPENSYQIAHSTLSLSQSISDDLINCQYYSQAINFLKVPY